MSTAIKILNGAFGRVALLDMNRPLVTHAHHHCHVLIKAWGGNTYFHARGRLNPLTEDTAVLINAWEPHSYAHPCADAPQSVILALYIEPAWLAQLQGCLNASAHPQFFLRPCVEISPRTRQLADRLVQTMLHTDEVSESWLADALFDLLLTVIEPFSRWTDMRGASVPLLPESSDRRIRKAVTLMQSELDSDIDSVASRCGLSRAHFYSLFRDEVGLTPNVYANVLRMESAIRHLTKSSDALCDVSYQLGFSAPGHFTRFFRQHLGIAPSDFRRTVRNVGLQESASSSHS
ncbi:helix-turn-helix transcriptional regulator [Paracandidimonas soli]|uniref:AraC-like DNA-binding protein n=1 Tax=Paracandidimonas soli TaxID=1917182 RepID=A0A4R3VE56_9BURK|nr:AraC family transcriptional regulator [Paracandidimonas soli]TCV01899.1 AraC-like DNA-binding protein [Paracandidimonas soli]